jgi:hypothetical protein
MTYEVASEILPEVGASRRLGRNLEHDSRSLRYLYPRTAAEWAPVRHLTDAPVLDQGALGACFPAGTRVRLANGGERPIEDLRLLDEVVTAEGRTGRVTRTMVRTADQGLIRLQMLGHKHLRLTPNHPVLTARGYVAAESLAVGDEIAMPRYSAGTTVFISTEQFVTNPSHRVTRGKRWPGVQGRRGLSVAANKLPEKVELTESFGRLIGLFLAEGSCDNSKVRWSFGSHEKSTLVTEAVRLIQDLFGVEAHIRDKGPAHNAIDVTLYGTGWALLFSALCGNGAGLKRPHDRLMGGSATFLAAVLGGWLDGDGHYRRDVWQGVTISPDLALAMYDIAQVLGRQPTINRREPVMNSAAATRQPIWEVSTADNHGRCRETETHVWRKLQALHREDYEGPVYNLSVEGDESYVAEGVGVHNCTGYAAAHRLGHGILPPEHITDGLARDLYSNATRLDTFDGEWPPTDTGSSGLAVAKAAAAAGYIGGYQHITDPGQLAAALAVAPVLVGTAWYGSMFDPIGGYVYVDTDSGLYGGHEYLCDEITDSGDLGFQNSWGPDWGRGGRFYIPRNQFLALLADRGDATVFTARVLSPTPDPEPMPDPEAKGCLTVLAKALTGRHRTKGSQ